MLGAVEPEPLLDGDAHRVADSGAGDHDARDGDMRDHLTVEASRIELVRHWSEDDGRRDGTLLAAPAHDLAGIGTLVRVQGRGLAAVDGLRRQPIDVPSVRQRWSRMRSTRLRSIVSRPAARPLTVQPRRDVAATVNRPLVDEATQRGQRIVVLTFRMRPFDVPTAKA